MSIITITSPAGTTKIKLIENEFTIEWAEHFATMVKDFQYLLRTYTFQRSLPVSQKTEISRTDANALLQYSRLESAIAELNKMGTNYPIVLDKDIFFKGDDESQDLLNRLHRSFTTPERCFQRKEPLIWSDKFDSSFSILPENKERFIELIDIINDAVHLVESNMYTSSKLQKEFQPTFFEIWFTAYTNDGTRLMNEAFHYIKKDHYKYFSDDPTYDVWVGRDITGKDHTIGYFDLDDPSEWDVTHILGYTGKVSIDLGIHRTELLNSESFRAWLAKHGVEYDPSMCGIPLGTVVEGKELLQKHCNASLSDVVVSIE
jgi:hypothetical protein